MFVGLLWLKLFGLKYRSQKQILQVWGKCMLLVCGVRVISNKWIPIEQFILMANHRSYLDVFIIAANIPAVFIAKAEVKNWPMMNAASELTNIIFVNRSELKSLINTMSTIKNMVNKGFPVAVFPEGTTSKGPLMEPFKKGIFKIAADLALPVIPAAIHYADENDAWVGNDTFAAHFLRQMGKPVTKAWLSLGEPVADENFLNLKLKVQKQIDSMLHTLAAKSVEGGSN